jgi:hypothetical protein
MEISGPMAKKTRNVDSEYGPTHRSGKQTGYDDLGGGKYRLAPCYVDRFSALADEKQGLNILIAAVNEHARKVGSNIAAAERRLWADIRDDLGLPENLNYRNGIVEIVATDDAAGTDKKK